METGLECPEITINSQNDCPVTEHKLYAQAQAGGESNWLGDGGPGGAWGYSTMDSGSSKARVGQGIVDDG